MSKLTLSVAVAAAIVSSAASAQPAPAGTIQVPKSPDDRDWYPQTGVYSPKTLVGMWFWVNGATLVQESVQPKAIEILTEFINNRAYSYSRTKDTEASAKIPAFASVSLQDKESETLTLDDISLATLQSDVGEPFCREWPTMRTRRTWAVGDELVYVVSDLLSHLAWKVGKEHDLQGGGGLGDYFSAEGKQYESTTISAILPANSFPQLLHKTITAVDIAGAPCPAVAKPQPHRFSMKSLVPKLGQKRLAVTKVILLTTK